MSRKRLDPKRAALLERQEKLRMQFEKDFSRMLRVTHRLEKTRQALGRIARQLVQLDAQTTA